MERSWWYRLTVILLFFGINSSAQILPAVLDLDIYGVTTRRIDLPVAATPTTPNYAIYNNRVITSQNMTVEAWVYLDSLDKTVGSVQYIANERITVGFNTNYLLAWGEGSKRFLILVRNGSNTAVIQSGVIADSTGLNIQDSTWIHVAGVCDCTSIPDTCQLTTYVNGVPGTTTKGYSPGGRFIPATNSLVIGVLGETLNNYDTALYGQIDELRIWNTARTSEQIKRYMKKRLRCPESGLVAYYTLNEGSGTTGGDCAGAATNLTLQRNTIFVTN